MHSPFELPRRSLETPPPPRPAHLAPPAFARAAFKAGPRGTPSCLQPPAAFSPQLPSAPSCLQPPAAFSPQLPSAPSCLQPPAAFSPQLPSAPSCLQPPAAFSKAHARRLSAHATHARHAAQRRHVPTPSRPHQAANLNPLLAAAARVLAGRVPQSVAPYRDASAWPTPDRRA
jgi:hypothetical protein